MSNLSLTFSKDRSSHRQRADIIVALAGSPNVGKSTLFNVLTGERQHVGNWPGKTIDRYEGELRYKGKNILVVDLPGTYSLGALSEEEVIARDFIVKERPDAVIVLVDSLEPYHTMYLALQVLELTNRVVIAFNKIDAAERRGIHIFFERIANRLPAPIVPISALHSHGLRQLLEKTIGVAEGRVKVKRFKVSYGALEKYIASVGKLIENNGIMPEYPSRWVAIRLIEGDKDLESRLMKTVKGRKVLEEVKSIRDKIRRDLGEDPDILLISRRYEIINNILSGCLHRERLLEYEFSEKLDKLVTHPVFGPLFSLIITFLGLFVIFSINTGFPLNVILNSLGFEEVAGVFENYSLAELMAGVFDQIAVTVEGSLRYYLPRWLIRLLTEGIIRGLGAVLSFFPLIFLTYLLFSFLEDAGIMARMGVAGDFILRRLGLSGKALMPLLLGFGCNVPAILGMRILEGEREHTLGVVLAPIIPCQARLIVILAIALAIYPSPILQVLVVTLLYLLAFALLGVVSLILRLFYLRDFSPPELLIELPPYHRPSLRVISWYAWEKSKDFLRKAGTVILLLSVILWFLLNWSSSGIVTSVEESFAATFAKALSPVGSLLGFEDWRIILALISGIGAKEVVLEALILSTGTSNPLKAIRLVGLTQLTAFILMLVTVVYTPCLPTLVSIYSETRSTKAVLITLIYELVLAFMLGFLVYKIGVFLGL
ncbi:MAG: ferrous iron transport protein B [Thermoprotei archaeon]|nr:MAG: ferrous iron transport protein B [Thermoprotei archaeon]RLF02569.1 MAG: ferrous iron transport protein B [Thermoprotei archaeon]